MGFYSIAMEQGGVMKSISKFPIWKVIKIGIGLITADDFRRAFESLCHVIDDSANDIIGRADFIVSKFKKGVELVVVSTADLGFKYNASRADIYKRAIELGLELCISEIGPQICLQCKNMSHGEYFNIAMLPIKDSYGNLRAFGVERDRKKILLHGGNGSPNSVWSINSKWVFVRK